ncbi:hypothetical protein [Pedobacter sp. MR2016-24]|uniref:hypothetical protein n=1 Tax=Pedobacter sp. MR2016-24 TaxID=2994466 RepID=UPI0022457105|nr:hypothetical protein [Pedobacter sp. MR2016-24]MCX2482116.1 hypothetical protein [Pedobacter sp. MR2016-24]
MKTLKIGYLISYDYEFVKMSLSRVYDFADEIFFAIDADRLTWSGENFTIKDEFWDWITQFDKDRKIRIYQDKFYVADLTPMQCDTRERNMLGKFMGKADWYIQIDSDEYFVDFSAFIAKLNNYDTELPTTVYCSVATLFKELPSGFLLINESLETLSFATNNPVYDLARNNTSGNIHIHWNDLVLHQSWARSPEEIQQKLNNWSHKNDFNVNSFYKLWNAIDEFNYNCLSNFHPLYSSTWPNLHYIKGNLNAILDSPNLGDIRGINPPAAKKKNLLSRLWMKLKSR